MIYLHQAMVAALTFGNIISLVFGTLVGIIVGVIPGLGPMVGMVALLPFSFALQPNVALSLLLGVFCGGYFGGAVPAILMGTPGVPSSLFTTFDGFPLTRKGQAQTALSFALVGSFSGGIISVIILVFLAPVLAHVAANFGPPEYFGAALFSVTLVAMVYRERLAQGLILLGLGFWISTVGIDGLTLTRRFTFGTLFMQNGFGLIPDFVGLFGVGQALILTEQEILQRKSMGLARRTLDFSKILEAFRYWKSLLKAGLVGTFVGFLPGTGSILASFLSYETVKRTSKHPEDFGKGTPEGCLASETGNNAVPAGAMIPLLTLGIPGDALSAVLMSVFTINGIYPGPLLLVKQPVLIDTLYISMFLINVVAFIVLALWMRPLAMIARVPSILLGPIIMIISLTGVYAINGRIFDVEVAIAMGALGYILLRLKWPIVNLVMGIVLGGILENRFRESMSISEGNPMIFLQRPISLLLIVMTIFIVAVPLFLDWRKRSRGTAL